MNNKQDKWEVKFISEPKHIKFPIYVNGVRTLKYIDLEEKEIKRPPLIPFAPKFDNIFFSGKVYGR